MKFLLFMLIEKIFVNSASSLAPAVKEISGEPGSKKALTGCLALLVILSSLMVIISSL